MHEEILVFIDGENLSIRYSEMVRSGRVPRTDTVSQGNFFVWNNRILNEVINNIRRVSYYSSVCGDDEKIRESKGLISSTNFTCRIESKLMRTAQILPFVRKKSSQSKKEGICDVNIAVDVMRACYRDHAKTIWVMSGDGDFIHLFHEVAHSGKRIFASAFSSGLNKDIPITVDRFSCLDDFFFLPDIPSQPVTPKRAIKPRATSNTRSKKP